MSLRAQIKTALKQGYKALGDIPRVVTYRVQSGDPIRDVDAGTSTLVFTDHVLKQVLIVKFSSAENDRDSTLKTDEKMLILSDDLPIAHPNPTDIVIDADGATWEVVTRLQDPADVIKIFRVRSTR